MVLEREESKNPKQLDFPLLNIKDQRLLDNNYSKEDIKNEFLNYPFVFLLTPKTCLYLNQTNSKQILEEKFFCFVYEFCNLNYLDQSGMYYYKKVYQQISLIFSKLTGEIYELNISPQINEEDEYFEYLSQIEVLTKKLLSSTQTQEA